VFLGFRISGLHIPQVDEIAAAAAMADLHQ